jgi:hypothetical protein
MTMLELELVAQDLLQLDLPALPLELNLSVNTLPFISH